MAACRFTLIAECSYTGICPPDEPEGREDLQLYAADCDDDAMPVGNVK